MILTKIKGISTRNETTLQTIKHIPLIMPKQRDAKNFQARNKAHEYCVSKFK